MARPLALVLAMSVVLSALLVATATGPAAAACSSMVVVDGDETVVTTVCDTSREAVHAGYASGHAYWLVPDCNRTGGGSGCEGMFSQCSSDPVRHYWIVYDGLLPVSRVCLSTDERSGIDEPWASDVEAAVARQGWQPAAVTVQPWPVTLVNLATNLSTSAPATQTASVVLLGHRTDIVLTANAYRWEFGDGATAVTTGPGTPYPRLSVVHAYGRLGRYAPRVSVSHAVTWTFSGRPWQALPQPVTVAGIPGEVAVVSATPRLVG